MTELKPEAVDILLRARRVEPEVSAQKAARALINGGYYSPTHYPWLLEAVTTVGINADRDDDGDGLRDWDEVDLGPALRGEMEPIVPTILEREDGRCLLYGGRVNGVHGDSGLGKSWVFLLGAAQQIHAGHHVVLVDFEEPNEASTVQRLLILGLKPETVEEHFHYLNPKTPASEAAIDKVCATVARYGATLVGVDSVGEAFGLEGINEDRDNEVGPWVRRVPRRIADQTGAAVVTVDHGTKASDNPLYPSGSKRKRAAITGASYLIAAPQPMTKEHGGRVELTCAKDRHGNYRRGAIAASVEFNVYPDGGMTWHVWPPSPSSTDGAELAVILAAKAAVRTVKELSEMDPPVTATQNTVVTAMKVRGSSETKRDGIDHAVMTGALREDKGSRNARIFVYIRPFDGATT